MKLTLIYRGEGIYVISIANNEITKKIECFAAHVFKQTHNISKRTERKIDSTLQKLQSIMSNYE